MDAPQNSPNSARLVDTSGISSAQLDALAGKDTALGHAVRRHLQDRDGSLKTTDVVFNSAL